MRRILVLSAVLLCVLACQKSDDDCNEQQESTAFLSGFNARMENTDDGIARNDSICGYIESVASGYFSKEHTYSGTPSEAEAMAINDFNASCEKIDTTIVYGKLKYGEEFRITLWEKETGRIVAERCFVGIQEETEPGHVYQTGYRAQMENTDDGKTRYEMIISYIESVDPDYFTEQHTYLGDEADTDRAAWTDFYNTCQKIDTAVVSGLMVGGEQFHLILYEINGENANEKGAMSWVIPVQDTATGNN